MSIIKAIFNNRVSGYAEAFKATDRTSSWMQKAIQEWFAMYFSSVQAANEGEDPCQQIPYTVVNKLTKTVFSEYSASSQDTFVAGILESLNKKRHEAMQKALIGGECLLKPIPTKTGWRWAVIHRASILVFARDHEGRMTDIGTAEYTTHGKFYYTLLERRTVDANGYLTIRNQLFRSLSNDSLGQKANLSDLPQYQDLQEEYTYTKPIGSIGLVTVKTPMVNCVDGTSEGVSVYAAAVPLIRNINRNAAQLDGEFDRGQSRIIVSGDMLKTGPYGKTLEDHVFVGLDDDAETIGITTFSPALREQSYLAREQAYLRAVENILGLKRGLLSEVEAAERTATEITSSQGEYNLTIIDFQNMWTDAVREAVRVCAILGQLYKVPGAHEPAEDAVTIDWGNGVLYDEEKTWTDYKNMVSAGLLKPEIALGWRFNMPTETPEDLAAIREKYMPSPEEQIEE